MNPPEQQSAGTHKASPLPPRIEMPREKLLRLGREGLSDEDLLALFLRTGISGCGVLELAAQLKKQAGSLAGLAGLEATAIQSLCKGIGIAKATTLAAVFELGRRAQQEVAARRYMVTASDIYDFLAPEMHALSQEHLVVLLLDTHLRLIVKKTVATGSLTQVVTHPRDIFREAIKHNAYCIVLAHNHPGCSTMPSELDRELTRVVYEAGVVMRIPLRDHVIIGHPARENGCPYFSFDERNLLKRGKN